MTKEQFIKRLTKLCVEAEVNLYSCGCCEGVAASGDVFYLGHINISHDGEFHYYIDDDHNQRIEGKLV